MKFLLVVLTLHLLIEWIGRRKERNKEKNMEPERNERVIHPAEFLLRDWFYYKGGLYSPR